MSSSNVKLNMQVVTPTQAAEWLSGYAYDFQRNLKNQSVAYYAGEMLNGDFDPTTVISLGRVNDGDWKLLDGQHRLAAVVKSGVHQTFIIKQVTYTSESDLADAYARTDQGSKRTIGDQAKAWQLADAYRLPVSWIGVFMAGIKFIDGKFGWQSKDKMHIKDVRRMMDEYHEAMLSYYASCGSSESSMRKPLLRSSAVSVGLVSFRFSARVFSVERVEQFWEGVALDDGLRRGDPRKRTHDHLLTTSMAYGTGKGRTVTAPYSARWVAACLNAWLEGKDEYGPPHPYVARPITILGSPFNGK